MANSRSSAAPVVAVAIVVLIVVLPVLYVLSIGPAIWLVNHGYVDENVAETMYLPVLLAVDKFNWLETLLNPWVDLFE
jgi:hypothetical protein